MRGNYPTPPDGSTSPVDPCSSTTRAAISRPRLSPRVAAWVLLPAHIGIWVGSLTTLVEAQIDKDVQKQEDQLIREFAPPPAAPAPVYRPPAPASQPEPAPPPAESTFSPEPAAPASRSPQPSSQPARKSSLAPTPAGVGRYALEFNRSPVVGNSLRLRSIHSEARLGFTRPRNWTVKSAKAVIRFQHSPALLANRSSLTVRVNGRSVGSTPLNRKQSGIGQLKVNIPPSLLQNYNEITLAANQNNSPSCSDPADPTLWTEVLPDSKILFEYQLKSVPLDFSRYPNPFFDELSLEPNQVAYLRPKQISESWLTSTAQFQAGLGRLADYRPLKTQLVSALNQVPMAQRLVVIGTPEEQPALKSLKLPYAIASNQFVDGSKAALPDDVGVLMLTTTHDKQVPVLVITGNSPVGVAKAVQFLLRSPQRTELGTGSAVLVDQLEDIPAPPPRQWSRYLPVENSFPLSALKSANNKPFQDVTVRGTYAPPVEVDFRALPDDRFKRGSTMTLQFSHSPQINPRLSTLEVRLDGAPLGGKRLTADNGTTRDSATINLPEELIQPNSKLQVIFNLVPKELGECGRAIDQQLWATLHGDTKFNLSRENSVRLPNLKLLQAGYPFAGPQDLSTTVVTLPDSPTSTEILTLLQVSERLGRLSQSDTVKLQAFTASTLPDEVRQQANLVGIGDRKRFPFQEAFQSSGFQLKNLFFRQSGNNQVQTLPDTAGVVKQIISPWNGDRALLMLTAQSDRGLQNVRDLFKKDTLFFQLKDDTVLINTQEKNPSEYDPNAYTLAFSREATQQRRIENISWLDRASYLLREHWYLLPTGIVLTSITLYGIVQLYFKRAVATGGKK